MSGKKRIWLTVAGVFFIIVATGVELAYLGVGPSSLAAQLTAYILINAAVLALGILIFLVLRTLAEFFREKESPAPGSSFRTRLVIIFIILVSVPAVALFLLTSRMVTGTVERWFSIRTEVPLESSLEIASRIYEMERARILAMARKIADERGVEAKTRNGPGIFVRVVHDPVAPDSHRIVRTAFEGRVDSEIDTSGHEEVVRAAAPVVRDGRVLRVVVVESVLPESLVRNIRIVQAAFENYKGLESAKTVFKSGYFLVLALVTAFIIFMTLWAALHVARSITDPIQALAEGTRQVADGRFDTELEVKTNDEFGMLTTAFNKMVAELNAGQSRLKRAYADVDSKRLILEGIMGNINTGVICLDNAGDVLTINNAACQILGIQPYELSRLTYKDILDEVESTELRDILRNLRNRDFSGKSWELKVMIRGVPVILRLFLSNLKDPEGNPVGILVVFDDITEVVQAQRAYAWQEVARRMTHEIKNPLTPIKLSAERLLKKHKEGSKDLDSVLESSVNTITREVEALRKMVNEFSRFGKLPELRLQDTNIEELVDEVLGLYGSYKDIAVTRSPMDGIPKARIDPEQIKRVLINLMDNAVEAAGTGGKVDVGAEFDPEAGIVRITVSDNGSGIRPEDKDRLFLPHFSTKKTGTGLGLAIVNKIISDHRGEIRVEDNQPQGARFVLELPVLQNV